MPSEWKKIGVIGVDAGLCWIGDPCYILHQDDKPNAIGKDWHDFVKKLEEQSTQLKYDMGHNGLGVVVRTGYGDGVYGVYAKYTEERIAEIRVVFIDDTNDTDDGSTLN